DDKGGALCVDLLPGAYGPHRQPPQQHPAPIPSLRRHFPFHTLERAMSECLLLKTILFLLTAYLFGLWELHRPEYPTCWIDPERLACWSLAAPTGR
uniref:hypothetical protein n=2 Tax=Pseudomonas TaxID=286 RepID=UPI00195528BB